MNPCIIPKDFKEINSTKSGFKLRIIKEERIVIMLINGSSFNQNLWFLEAFNKAPIPFGSIGVQPPGFLQDPEKPLFFMFVLQKLHKY